ncbi:MAG: Mut7-C ubiquitin/RNAse domain-containing protein [Nitrosomonas sp.]|nr:Mut7-C ubiquitin/RNAse domain-containing protein [Nitrosomonas sp.]MBP6075841.1 Mut7-C ubiquitin/RNAse domain-containing protein [Nitrosomonas sp.]
MAQIRLHFYQSLNDFVERALRDTEIIHNLDRKASVKDMIESFNVPHTEIELILVNGIAVDFSYIVQCSDYIQVYPASEHPVVTPLLPLRPTSMRPPLFLVDVNLGRLARYLRLLGFDCCYRNDYDDATVARIASEQQRTVLTRDRTLLQRRIITYGYFVRASLPKIQTQAVLKRFDLYALLKPLTRCTHCNGQLVETEKQKIEHRLEPLTKQHYDRFLMCPECDRIYWQGSHCERVKHLIDDFLAAE